MFGRAFELFPPDMMDTALLGSVLRGIGTSSPAHRSSGTRAHRQWKRRRASGITKRVRA